MRDLKNFQSTKKDSSKNQDSKTENTQNVNEDKIKKMIDDRSGKSEEELMSELKSEVKKSKSQGKFNQDEIDNFKKTVLPFLTDEQKSRLDEIIKAIT